MVKLRVVRIFLWVFASLFLKVTELLAEPQLDFNRDIRPNDTSDKAYETVVDRLMASPQYGDRMALL
jgi:hypothetical protein